MITYDTAVAEVRETIADKGEDYVYSPVRGASSSEGTMCAYFYEGKPSCLIGQWMNRYHGVTDAGVFEGDEARTVVPAILLNVEHKAADFLQELQEEQDRGLPWGLALEKALTHMENRIES